MVIKNKQNKIESPKKTTAQGSGKHTRKNYAGGETHYENVRSGSPPGRRRRHHKTYRGQGR